MIAQALKEQREVQRDEIAAPLHIVQHFQPGTGHGGQHQETDDDDRDRDPLAVRKGRDGKPERAENQRDHETDENDPAEIADVVPHRLTHPFGSQRSSQPEQDRRDHRHRHGQQRHRDDFGHHIIHTVDRAGEIEWQGAFVPIDADHLRGGGPNEDPHDKEDAAEIPGIGRELQIRRDRAEADHDDQRDRDRDIEHEREHLGRPALANAHRPLHRLADERTHRLLPTEARAVVAVVPAVEDLAVVLRRRRCGGYWMS